MFIKAEHIYLRAVEKDDLETLYNCENNTEVWKVSNTQVPYSKHVLEQYLEASHQDIYTNKQLRLMICLTATNEVIGTVDLFDFDPAHARVGVGILIFNEFRNKGYAFNALTCLKQYAFDMLLVNQLYCNISSSNKGSIHLFERLGFNRAGVKKQWNKISINTYEDEYIYQLLQQSI
jgi:diamine N-acetyltransferase